MNQEDYQKAMIAVEFANTAVAAADSRAARKHATQEAEKARDWQEDMYDRQLDDNIAWRTHQEQYNSPEAQMQRYRDAGINPMYAVTQGGSSNIVTPNATSVPMTQKADTPAPRNLRFNAQVLQQAMITKAQVKALDAEANKYNAEANEANERANGYKYDNVGKSYEADVMQALKQTYSTLFDTLNQPLPWAQVEAAIRVNKREYDYVFAGMDFQNAKKTFEHLDAVRSFEKALQNHQRAKFQHELSQAESAASIFKVSARWAIANQWIDSASQLLGAGASLFGAVKGTSYMPNVSRSYTESYGDHTSHTFHYKPN